MSLEEQKVNKSGIIIYAKSKQVSSKGSSEKNLNNNNNNISIESRNKNIQIEEIKKTLT